MNRLLLALVLITNFSFAADHYWVGGTGSWTDKGMWASTSGGAGGIGAPTTADKVIFDDNSFTASTDTVFMNGNLFCADVDFTGLSNFTPTVYLNGNSKWYIYGSVSLVSNLKMVIQGITYFKATTTGNNIDIAGHSLDGQVEFDGLGGVWTLRDKLTVGSTGWISIKNGFLKTNDQEINAPSLSNGDTPGPRGLDLGNSIINLTTTWNFQDTSNLTLLAGTSEITVQAAGSTPVYFEGGGLSYYDVRLGGSRVTLSYPDYFKYLELMDGIDVTIDPFMSGITVDNLIAHGTVGDSVDIMSSVSAYQAFLSDNDGGFNCIRYARIREVIFSGAGFNAEMSRDMGMTSGVTYAPCGALDITVQSWDEKCYQACDGQAQVNIKAGVGPFDIQWSDPAGSVTSYIGDLCPGTYYVQVTDEFSSAVINDTVEIAAAPVMTINISTTDVTCNGLNNGTAIAVPTGLQAPISYDWNSGFASTQSITNLAPGQYDLRVSDMNDCMLLDTIQILEPAVLVATAAGQDAKCKGEASGNATVTVTGGNGGESYSWSSGQTTQTITGIAAGTYIVTVTDAQSCVDADTVTIAEPATKLTLAVSTLNATCPSACDGTGSATASGGVGPYNYLWRNSGFVGALTNSLCGGPDTISVMDSVGCILDSAIVVGADGVDPVLYIDSVTHSQGTVSKAWVYLLSWRSGSKMPKVDSLRLDDPTPHVFSNVPTGPYVVYVKPDKSLVSAKLIPSFHGKTNKWEKATGVNLDCDDTTNIVIEMMELSTSAPGTATISGRVTTTGLGKARTAGDPVPGIDITIEQNPGGYVKQFAVTDDNGEYLFDSVPAGDYDIYVDVPGLPLDTTYTIGVNDNDTVFVDKDFCVDSSWVDICEDTSGVSVATLTTFKNNSIKVYPNPYKGQTNIVLELERGYMQLEVFNVLGKRIAVLDEGLKPKGKYNYIFSASSSSLSPGIYILKLTHNNQISTQRMIELH